MVNGINNIGSGLRALAQTTANTSTVSATIISSPPGISAAKLNWLPVVVANTSQNNLLSLRTPMGEMSVRMTGFTAQVGDRLLVKLQSNGTMNVKPDFNQVGLDRTNVAGQQNSSLINNVRSSYSPAVAVSLANVEPIKASITGGVSNPNYANKVVSSIFPHFNSGAFSFAAALFPHNVRGGMLAEAVKNQESSSIAGRTHDLAEKMLTSPAPRIEGSMGWLGWNLPFYNQSKLMESRWFSRDEEPEDEIAPETRKHTIVDIYLEFAGRVQISCLTDGENAHINISSERPLPDGLAEELLATSTLVAKVLGINATAEIVVGLDNMLTINSS